MFSLFKRNPYRGNAVRLYDQLVAAARNPAFYAGLGVPDTLDGRFECISLHVFAVIFRLKNEQADPKAANLMAQALFDAMFKDMDHSLREMGVGDLGVPKKMKVMMKSFNGRCHVYATALMPNAPEGALSDALRRNLYGTVVGPEADNVLHVSAYLVALLNTLMNAPLSVVVDGRFAAPVLNTVEVAHEKAA